MSDTRKFLDNVLAGKSAESRTQFDGVMSQKMNAALDLRKMSLTSELFGKKVAEETLEEGTYLADHEIPDTTKKIFKSKTVSKNVVKRLEEFGKKKNHPYGGRMLNDYLEAVKQFKAGDSTELEKFYKALTVFSKFKFDDMLVGATSQKLKLGEETLEEGTSKEDLIAQAMKWDKEAGFANEYSDFADLKDELKREGVKKIKEEKEVIISEAKEIIVSIDFAGTPQGLKKAARKHGVKIVKTQDVDGDLDGIADVKGTKENILKLLTDPNEYGYDREEAIELYTDLK